MGADTISPWVPESNAMLLRRLGKTIEETGELIAVLGRCICQGIDETDPSSGKVNRRRLEEESADVAAQLATNAKRMQLDVTFMAARELKKRGLMDQWEALFESPKAVATDPLSIYARDSMNRPLCPTCGSHEARLHPALGFEGEVQTCSHAYHADPAVWRFSGYEPPEGVQTA